MQLKRWRLDRRSAGPLAVATVLLSPAAALPAAADPAEAGASSRVSLYQDDDATTVVTTAVRGTMPLGTVGAVRAAWIADVVTSASVDVVTAATRAIHERRDELRVGLDVAAGDAVLSADWAHSTESDYASDGLSLGTALDLPGHAAAVRAGASVLYAEVGRAADRAFAERLRVWTGELGVTQVVDERTVVSLAASAEWDDGYQSSPYRFVLLEDGNALPESHPRSRARGTLTGRLRRSLSARTAAALDERLYRDDWGIWASSTTARLVLTVATGLDLELRNRLHAQSSAAFWRRRYPVAQRWVSADRELSALLDDFVGPALVYEARGVGPFDRLRFDAGAEAFVFRFLDSDRIDARVGVTVSAGVEGRL